MYIECVAELRWRSSGPPFLFSPLVSLLYSADTAAFVSVDPLAGQCHQIPHQFVEIEREDRSWPCHLQRVPKTFLRFVELVPVAFQGPDHPFGLPTLAADLVPDCLGNRPGS